MRQMGTLSRTGHGSVGSLAADEQNTSFRSLQLAIPRTWHDVGESFATGVRQSVNRVSRLRHRPSSSHRDVHQLALQCKFKP